MLDELEQRFGDGRDFRFGDELTEAESQLPTLPASIAGSDSRFGWECDSLSTRRGSDPAGTLSRGAQLKGFETADKVMATGSALRPPHAIRGKSRIPSAGPSQSRDRRSYEQPVQREA